MDSNIENTKNVNEFDINQVQTRRKIYIGIKRIIDIIGALIGCIFLLPLTLIIWLANLIVKDKGPVFYVQKRIGKNGKTFRLYKYRSMVVDADKKLKKYLLENPEANEEFVKYRKLTNDPRITPIGKFIRKTSIDEFPQFINVLKGNMSLVGPRPYLTREKRAMGESYNEIIKVKPGLTGPWQVNGRSEISFEERLKIEEEYSKNLSFLTDFKCFFKTFSRLFKNKGAI